MGKILTVLLVSAVFIFPLLTPALAFPFNPEKDVLKKQHGQHAHNETVARHWADEMGK